MGLEGLIMGKGAEGEYTDGYPRRFAPCGYLLKKTLSSPSGKYSNDVVLAVDNEL
jgi:hypothetical protein